MCTLISTYFLIATYYVNDLHGMVVGRSCGRNHFGFILRPPGPAESDVKTLDQAQPKVHTLGWNQPS